MTDRHKVIVPDYKLLLAFTTMVVFETISLVAAASGQLEPLNYGLAHAGGLVAGCIFVWMMPTRARTRSLAAIAVMLTFVAGPFGGVCSLALLWPRGRGLRIAPHVREIEPMLRHFEKVTADLRARRLQVRVTSSRPLMDVFLVGTDDQQLTALGRMLKRYEPAMAAILGVALQSHEPSVRVLAATVISKLHRDFSEQIASSQRVADARAAPSSVWLDLAAACTAYARSGLLDRTQCAELEFRATSARGHFSQLDPMTIESA